MSAFAICATAAPVRPVVRSFAGKKASGARVSPASSRAVVAQASPMEVFTVANEAAFISGTAGTMISMVLIGLALGFVLLRVESLVEEGKL